MGQTINANKCRLIFSRNTESFKDFLRTSDDSSNTTVRLTFGFEGNVTIDASDHLQVRVPRVW